MNGITIATKLQKIQDGISGVKGNAEISEKMSEYGYTAERLAEGEALLAEARSYTAGHKQDYSEQYVATSEIVGLWLPGYSAYMITLKVMRVALKDKPEMLTRFNATGRRSRSLTGWLSDAKIFYTNLLKSPEALAAAAKYGITKERLNQEKQMVDGINSQHSKQQGTKGVAQQSTVARDKAIDDACDWYSDFRAIARVALYEKPQLLEALGITKK